MRFITLDDIRVSMLARIYKRSKHHRVRQRAHCILLSHAGRTIAELTEIFGTDRTTIYNWFNAWKSESLVGLYDRKGKGRKSKLSPEIRDKIMELIQEYPEDLSEICAVIEKQFSVSVSTKTIERFLKSSGIARNKPKRIQEKEAPILKNMKKKLNNRNY
ncbi:MAG: helix-turn-helix domain containing protein [Desulfobacteraceae bacterium]|nr:helix-turn-helix domain containing protein [Desulfobacteraceae bacterium]